MKKILLLSLLISASAFSQDYRPSRANDYDSRSYVPGQNNINRNNPIPTVHNRESATRNLQQQFNREMEYQDQRQMYNLMNGRRIND